MDYDMSNWEDNSWLDDNPNAEDYDDPEDLVKECNYCKGTGIDRRVEADCLKCYGEGYV
jgi:hypothetical protein